jgi:hypothetical protein
MCIYLPYSCIDRSLVMDLIEGVYCLMHTELTHGIWMGRQDWGASQDDLHTYGKIP